MEKRQISSYPYYIIGIGKPIYGQKGVFQNKILNRNYKKFVCNLCGKKYKHNISIRSHLRKVHNLKI
jgi:hypothetical protein